MQPTLQSADSAGLLTYIEASSDRSAALYERLGFVPIDVLELPEGGRPVRLMRSLQRDPFGPENPFTAGRFVVLIGSEGPPSAEACCS
ncbi:MAG: hypothetical protein JO304_01010 [Solirubrobacterales bacterium]|nr:hypothetical protein [Solirubrobacterales bacterium]MBV9047999.1 hypothetical protein [Solirubrobacterales bacterium]